MENKYTSTTNTKPFSWQNAAIGTHDEIPALTKKWLQMLFQSG